MGRSLSEEQCQSHANDLIDCMKMWDIGKADAYRITVIMKGIAQNTHNDKWKNPLVGSGLKIAPADDGSLTAEQELTLRNMGANISHQKPN